MKQIIVFALLIFISITDTFCQKTHSISEGISDITTLLDPYLEQYSFSGKASKAFLAQRAHFTDENNLLAVFNVQNAYENLEDVDELHEFHADWWIGGRAFLSTWYNESQKKQVIGLYVMGYSDGHAIYNVYVEGDADKNLALLNTSSITSEVKEIKFENAKFLVSRGNYKDLRQGEDMKTVLNLQPHKLKISSDKISLFFNNNDEINTGFFRLEKLFPVTSRSEG